MPARMTKGLIGHLTTGWLATHDNTAQSTTEPVTWWLPARNDQAGNPKAPGSEWVRARRAAQRTRRGTPDLVDCRHHHRGEHRIEVGLLPGETPRSVSGQLLELEL